MSDETKTADRPRGIEDTLLGKSKLGQTALMGVAPQTFSELWQFASVVAKTSFVPDSFRPQPGQPADAGAVLACFQMGAEVGLKPMTSLKWISVIHGRPSIWGDGAYMLARAHPRFEYLKELDAKEAGKVGYGQCTIKLRGEEAKTITYTKEMAEREGVWGGSGATEEKKRMSAWYKYPGRKLQTRARLWCIRDVVPEALGGLSIGEEVEDEFLERDVTPQSGQPEAQEATEPEKETVEPEVIDPDPPKKSSKSAPGETKGADAKVKAMAKAKRQEKEEERAADGATEGGQPVPGADPMPDPGPIPETLSLTPQRNKGEEEDEWIDKAKENAFDEAALMRVMEEAPEEFRPAMQKAVDELS